MSTTTVPTTAAVRAALSEAHRREQAARHRTRNLALLNIAVKVREQFPNVRFLGIWQGDSTAWHPELAINNDGTVETDCVTEYVAVDDLHDDERDHWRDYTVWIGDVGLPAGLDTECTDALDLQHILNTIHLAGSGPTCPRCGPNVVLPCPLHSDLPARPLTPERWC